MNKPKVIKNYDKLDKEVQQQIKLNYPQGFSESLIQFYNKDGKLVSALPFETEDRYYLVRMTALQAEQIIDDDDDYNIDGTLKPGIKVEYEGKIDDINPEGLDNKFSYTPDE